MGPLIWSEHPKLRSPYLVCAFRGWNDAAEAATGALAHLASSLSARDVAEIDPEEFFDFTAVRPMITLDEGATRSIEWPKTRLLAAEIPGADRDIALLVGTEPALKWRTYSEAVVEFAQSIGVEMVVTLGALLGDIPHSRPTAITGLASDPVLVERLGLSRSNYQGPTGIVGVLHTICAREGLPSVSFWAAVPHYIAAAPNPKAALELVRRVEGIAGVAVDATALETASEEYESRVAQAVASDPEIREFVERLEASADEAGVDDPPPAIPSGETIAQDFQRYLRQRGPGELAGDESDE